MSFLPLSEKRIISGLRQILFDSIPWLGVAELHIHEQYYQSTVKERLITFRFRLA